MAKPNPIDPELQETFNRFDTDGDGKISISEISAVLAATGSTVSSHDLRCAVEEIDSDKDGFVNITEFAALCRSSGTEADAELKDAFDLYDEDKNGLISVKELHRVLSRLGMKRSVEDCARMVESVDEDGDGNVNFAEFEKMMRSPVV